jgi:quinol monooxygenase YgiN
MAEAIMYIDQSEIRPGKVEEVRSGVTGLVEYVRTREPQLISYAFYIDEAASSMSVVAVHPDSASLELHMRIGGPEFRKMAEFIDLQLIEVYGSPSDAVLDQLHQKARMLGEKARVVVHKPHAGFGR